MESMLRFLSRFLRARRGSSTVEYVVILAVGALLATLLFHALQGDEVKSAIRTAVEKTILGETVDAPGKDTNNIREGNRYSSDIPDPAEIPEPLMDSNNSSDSTDSLENQSDRSPSHNGFIRFGNLFSLVGVSPGDHE